MDGPLRRARMRRLGASWLEPALTALELGPDGYREIARITGDETYDAAAPFPVAVRLR